MLEMRRIDIHVIVFLCNMCSLCAHWKTIKCHIRMRRNLKTVKKKWKITSGMKREQCGQVWWNVSRGYNDASSGSKNCAKCPSLAVGYKQSAMAKIARLAGVKSQLRRFVHVDWVREWQRKISCLARDQRVRESIMTSAVINADYIESQRFLEDAGNVVLERVRDIVERQVVWKWMPRSMASSWRRINMLIRA